MEFLLAPVTDAKQLISPSLFSTPNNPNIKASLYSISFLLPKMKLA